MKIIHNECAAIRNVIAYQAIKPGCYVPSMYNYMVQVDGNNCVYNTFTRLLAIISREEWEILSSEPKKYSDLDDRVSDLIKHRLLVPNELDEEAAYLQLLALIESFDRSDAIDSYTILTTTACNARCFYCFESGFKPETMKAQTANDLAEYIVKHSKERSIKLHWFGGEPLCNTEPIRIVTKLLRESGITFQSTITTNGYNFNESLIAEAKEIWNLLMAQITLDGMPHVHNERKRFVTNDPNPFEKIIQNVHMLLNHDITVSLRLNFDINNLDSVYSLIEYLDHEFPKTKLLAIYPAILFESCAAWDSQRTIEHTKELRTHLRKMQQILLEKNRFAYAKVKHELKRFACGANNPKHRTINPNGTFSVCHNVGDTCFYGSIYDGITDIERYHQWMAVDHVRDQCKSCKWLPDCTGFAMCPTRKSFCMEDVEFKILKHIENTLQKRKGKSDD